MNIVAKLGVTDINEPGTVMRVVKFVKHHHFDAITLNNDIAVITLECSVPFSPNIYIIPLPVVKSAMDSKMGEVSGWGYTQVSYRNYFTSKLN